MRWPDSNGKGMVSHWVPLITQCPQTTLTLSINHTHKPPRNSGSKRGPPNQLATPPRSSHRLHTTPSLHCACTTDVLERRDSPPFFTITPPASSWNSRLGSCFRTSWSSRLSKGRGLQFSPVMCHVLHLASLLWAHFHTFSFRGVVLFSATQAAMSLTKPNNFWSEN